MDVVQPLKTCGFYNTKSTFGRFGPVQVAHFFQTAFWMLIFSIVLRLLLILLPKGSPKWSTLFPGNLLKWVPISKKAPKGSRVPPKSSKRRQNGGPGCQNGALGCLIWTLWAYNLFIPDSSVYSCLFEKPKRRFSLLCCVQPSIP